MDLEEKGLYHNNETNFNECGDKQYNLKRKHNMVSVVGIRKGKPILYQNSNSKRLLSPSNKPEKHSFLIDHQQIYAKPVTNKPYDDR